VRQWFRPESRRAVTASRRMNKKELSERDICTKFITPCDRNGFQP
jgi:hypothetical protein